MAIDTFGQGFCTVDISPENEDRATRLRRLVDEDSALRPWMIGKALREANEYTRWQRVKLAIRDGIEAVRWSWQMSQ